MDRLAVIYFLESIGITDFTNKEEFLDNDEPLEFTVDIYDLICYNIDFYEMLNSINIHPKDLKEHFNLNPTAISVYEFVFYEGLIEILAYNEQYKEFELEFCSILAKLVQRAIIGK